MNLIECRNLAIGYGKNILAENLNINIREADYLCVIGENGSGKTTFMKTLLGLEAPLEGSVSFSAGMDRSRIGYLPQQDSIQDDFPASVWEIVLSGCQNRMGARPFYTKKEKTRAKECMEKLDIMDIMSACYSELSGGQKQRVLLARAVCAAEKVLVLDEPVTGLDPEAADNMYQMIRKLNENGMSILMISHDVDEASGYAKHILKLGDDPWYGTGEEFKELSAGVKKGKSSGETEKAEKGGAL